MINMIMVQKRATDVINGFVAPRRINAVDTVKTLMELHKAIQAYQKLEKELAEAIRVQESLAQQLADLKDRELGEYVPPFSFEDLFKPKY